MSVENVGARLSLLNGPAFRAGLAAATTALQAFNDEQERAAGLAKSTSTAVSTSAKAQADAVVASSDVQVEAVDRQAAAQREALASYKEAQAGMLTAQKEYDTKFAAASKETLAAASAASSKILKYTVAGAAVIGYEGVKSYMSFQQMISQTAIDAGVKKSQLPAFTKMALDLSVASGVSASNIADMMYRIASANPGIGTTTKAMKGLVTQAANLVVLAGATGDPDSVARMYGAIASNQLSLNQGGKAIPYTSAGGAAINQWVLSTVGHGDIKTGDLVTALGTGILPVAKTYGLSLNDVGAALDVLSPAMNASAAATRLKTAIGMLGSPSQKTSQAMELIGGSGTTLSGLLRSQGLGGALSYLGNLQNTVLSASSFVGGGIFGAASGKYSGQMGGADWLKAYGFTNPALVSLLQTKGAGGLKGLSSSQLASLGFTQKGITGTQAAQTVTSDLIGQMFGGGHTGAAIMQLVNEYGTYKNKLAGEVSGENPKTYGQALSIAYSEPIVKWHQFEAWFKKFSIEVGSDITPKLDAFLGDLMSLGAWFGKNKGALSDLEHAGEGLVAGAAAIKLAQITAKVVQGGTSIVKAILNPSSTLKTLFGGGAGPLDGAALKLDAAAEALQLAADKLGASGYKSDIPVGGPGGGTLSKTERDAEEAALYGGGALFTAGRKILSKNLLPGVKLGDAGLAYLAYRTAKIATNPGLKLNLPNAGDTTPWYEGGSGGIPFHGALDRASNDVLSGVAGFPGGVVSGAKSAFDSITSLFGGSKTSQPLGDYSELEKAVQSQSTAAGQQKTSAQLLQEAANNLNKAAENAMQALAPGNLHSLAAAGGKTATARHA